MSDVPLRQQMADALAEVRREGYKVAVIYAVVDAALVTLAVNLLLQVVTVGAVPETVRPLGPLSGVLSGSGLSWLAGTPVGTSTLAGAVAGLLTFVVEFVLRVRRPLVEQFEAANPSIRESLRTARDTVEDGRETVMALALYRDVLDRLRDTSSLELVDTRRLVVTVAVLVAVSLASIQVAVVDLNLGLDGPDGGDGPDQSPTQRPYEGLRDGDAILGDAENVSAGDTELDADLQTQGGGESGNGSSAAAYDQSGFASSADVESQQAGFAPADQVEDAELIREYNLKIRDIEDDDS
jgi:hypothetical protein